jgi:uncharacterized protein
MIQQLTEVEARVVGALVEKQITTPEYFPLTLNSLTAACNQKTNRDPVVSFDEETVQTALDSLRDKNIALVIYRSGSRVAKYKHMFPKVYEISPAEVAVLCVLMLRGFQTLGEIRERSSRLYEFPGLGEVSETLEGLIKRDEPAVMKLERQAGQKEVRFAHLLCGEIDVTNLPVSTSASHKHADNERLIKLEDEVKTLRSELDEFKSVFEEFKKQFD